MLIRPWRTTTFRSSPVCVSLNSVNPDAVARERGQGNEADPDQARRLQISCTQEQHGEIEHRDEGRAADDDIGEHRVDRVARATSR